MRQDKIPNGRIGDEELFSEALQEKIGTIVREANGVFAQSETVDEYMSALASMEKAIYSGQDWILTPSEFDLFSEQLTSRDSIMYTDESTKATYEVYKQTAKDRSLALRRVCKNIVTLYRNYKTQMFNLHRGVIPHIRRQHEELRRNIYTTAEQLIETERHRSDGLSRSNKYSGENMFSLMVIYEQVGELYRKANEYDPYK